MTKARDIEIAFDTALDQVQRAAASGMETLHRGSASDRLARLERDLRAERDKALERGAVDSAWIRKTIRWVVEWAPATDLTIIAALGRIARLAPTGLS